MHCPKSVSVSYALEPRYVKMSLKGHGRDRHACKWGKIMQQLRQYVIALSRGRLELWPWGRKKDHGRSGIISGGRSGLGVKFKGKEKVGCYGVSRVLESNLKWIPCKMRKWSGDWVTWSDFCVGKTPCIWKMTGVETEPEARNLLGRYCDGWT